MHDRFQQLVNIYLTGSLTEEQRRELIALLENEELSTHLADLIGQQLATGELSIDADLANTQDRIVQQVIKKIQSPVSLPRIPFYRKWGWAAAAMLILGSGAYLWSLHKKDAPSLSNRLPNDVAPGGNRAILTLSDGTTIALDSAASGAIARQGNASVVKSSNGGIAYNSQEATNGADAAVLMNTLRTPRGGQYSLTLPDGTRVWLNAASAITYPASFTGKERRVNVTGEVYFEVATDKTRPFIADVDGLSSIEVLGTHFDVNSYTDEGPVRTTLLEGRVRVAVTGTNSEQEPPVILKPGQQAQVSRPGLAGSKPLAAAGQAGQQAQPNGGHRLSVINNPNIDGVMAWKNGLFNFENAGLEEVMRQLERWYDVDVVYEKGIPDIRFEGEISRDIKLSDLLKVLARADVKFRIEQGRRLVVLP